MKRIKFIFAILISISLFSCFNADLGKGLKKVENLQIKLDTIKANFQKIDNEKIKSLYDTMMQDIDTVAVYTNRYPENKKFKEAYSLYSETAHMAKNFFKRSYDKEITYSETQLKNLKTDIENNVLNIDSIKVYLIDETNAISTLDEKIKIHFDVSNRIIDRYKRTKPIVNQYIDSLKNTAKY